ncbi:MAG: hypothetical protein ACOX22_00325 [Caldicoprobacterales bacterium]|jgi:hypothetical protein
MEERDILVFTDEDGEEIELEILDYFEYDGEEYVMLIEPEDEGSHEHVHEHNDECPSCSQEEEKNIYLMKVVTDGDTEEFLPVDTDKMDELIEAIEELYADEEYDEEYNDEEY